GLPRETAAVPADLRRLRKVLLVAAKIEITKAGDDGFQVRVSESKSETRHTVTLKHSDYIRLTGNTIGPEALIRLSFEFLLEREPKESILPRFDLMVISRYFPQYETEIQRRISSS